MKSRPHQSRQSVSNRWIESLEPRTLLAGNGLAGTYFNSTELTDAKFSRTDTQVRFNWSNASPSAAVGSDYSVRWTGRVQARFTEQYRLITAAAGGVRLWINDQLIINDWTPHASRANSGYFNFVAGQRYNVRLEYRSDGSASTPDSVNLYWQSARQAKEIIPASMLYSSTPDRTAPTAPRNLRASYVTDTAIKMIWSASSEASGTVYYDIYYGKTKLDTVTGTSYTRAGRSPGTDYSITVIAMDAFANSAASSTMVHTPAAAPSAGGTGLAGKYFSGSAFQRFRQTRTDAAINFDWDNVPVETTDGNFSVTWQGYLVPKYTEAYMLHFTANGGERVVLNGNTIINNWTDHTGTDSATVMLRAGTRYTFRVEYHGGADSSAKLEWASLSQVRQVIPAGQLQASFIDKTAPTTPSNLRVSATTSDTVAIQWNASSDDIGVAGYDIYRGAERIATIDELSYTDSGLSPGTLYQYKVVAIDGADRSSASTAGVSATTTTPVVTGRDALQRTPAGSYDAASGVSRNGNNVTSFDAGDWIQFSKVDFRTGVASVMITLALPTTNVGGQIELRLDSATGPVIGTLVVQPTGSFATYYTQQTQISGATGEHNLFLVGKSRANLANIQAIQFSTKRMVKVMALGDSITQEFTSSPSWRYYLDQQLRDAGYAVDFVGSQTQGTDGYAPNFDFDQNHEGHSGWTTDEILAQVSTWASAATPDVVLIHLGTNDLRYGGGAQNAIRNLGLIIDALRAVNPNVKVVLATIIPMNEVAASVVQSFNGQIPGIVSAKSTAASPVVLADQYTGFSLALDSDDGLHPNDAGDRLMANRWFDKLEDLLA